MKSPDKDNFNFPKYSKNTITQIAVAVKAATDKAYQAPQNETFTALEIKKLLDKLLTSPRPDHGLDMLVRTKILEKILPEVFAMVDFGEGVRHKDVWKHTRQVVCQTPLRLNLRWAALFHDIGKVPTRKFQSSGKVTFTGHPEKGARMFEKITQRLPFEKESKNSIRFLIASHLRPSSYKESWTDSAVRRFYKDAGDYLEDLFDLSRADITSKYEKKVKMGLYQINLLAKRASLLAKQDLKPRPLPTGLGTFICEKYNKTPGKWLGSLMRVLMNEVENGALECQNNYEYYLDFIEKSDKCKSML